MAVDEAILDGYADRSGDRGGTLRLYSWDPPALSLGRSQTAGGAFDPDYLRAEGIDLVRRVTGGLAVFHEHERTFAVSGPLRAAPFDGGVVSTYRRIAAALHGALARLGIEARVVRRGTAPRPVPGGDPACFQVAAAHEIAVEDRKVIGSAQVRRRGAFLQHGSILLRADPHRLARVLGTGERESRFTDLRTVLGREPDPDALDDALVEAFESELNLRLHRGALSSSERERATRLYSWKHNALSWIMERRIGSREARWGPLG
jgi:lipoate-protein ligase A